MLSREEVNARINWWHRHHPDHEELLPAMFEWFVSLALAPRSSLLLATGKGAA